jgi:hypothetical protein
MSNKLFVLFVLYFVMEVNFSGRILIKKLRPENRTKKNLQQILVVLFCKNEILTSFKFWNKQEIWKNRLPGGSFTRNETLLVKNLKKCALFFFF